MKVLITGATGLPGRHLVKELQQRGEQVRALVLPMENADELLQSGVELIRGNIVDARTLGPAVQGIDLVFHLAEMANARRSLLDYYLVNVTGSENLYRAALTAGVRRFVYASSHVVYGLGNERPQNETAALRPDAHPYCISKAAGDRLMRHFMLNSPMEMVILRPATPFGSSAILRFQQIVQRLKAGRGIIIGRGDNALPFCYSSDIIQGFLLAGYQKRAQGNVYNIANDDPLLQREMLDILADAVDGIRPTLHIPYLPVYYGSRLAERMLGGAMQLGIMLLGTENRYSVEKARRELGYTPRADLRSGIKLAAACLQNETLGQAVKSSIEQPPPLVGARG